MSKKIQCWIQNTGLLGGTGKCPDIPDYHPIPDNVRNAVFAFFAVSVPKRQHGSGKARGAWGRKPSYSSTGAGFYVFEPPGFNKFSAANVIFFAANAAGLGSNSPVP